MAKYINNNNNNNNKEIRGKEKKGKTPQFNYTALPSQDDDFDFFPHLKSNQGSREHQNIMKSLKEGSYQAYMQEEEYSGEYNKQSKTFSASIKNRDFITAPNAETFSANFDSEKLDDLATLYQTNKNPIRRRYYANPRQYYDIILLADAYTNSFAGTVIDHWCDSVTPRTLQPVLKLRRPSNDQKANTEAIKKHQYVIDALKGLDEWFSDMGPEPQDKHFDVSLQQKLKAAFKLRETFGRSAIVKENWDELTPVTIDGTEYPDIPNTLKIIHPIEMGITEVELYSGKIAGTWLHNDQPYVPMENMIYLINEYSSPQVGSATYGYARPQRAIDQVRLYRRIMAKNFPQFLRASASGMGAFLINTTGYSAEDSKNIRVSLKNAYKTTELAVIDYANIADFEFKEFKINTDISHLVTLHNTMLQTISNVMGIPQSLVYDDSSPARGTFVGRLVMYQNFQVAKTRSTYGEQIRNQWYMPNARLLNFQKELKEFYIDVEFEDTSLETKQEKIDRLIQENDLNPYTDEYLGQELDDPDYLNHIDPEKKKKQEELSKSSLNNGNNNGKPKKSGETFSIRDHATQQKTKITQT